MTRLIWSLGPRTRLFTTQLESVLNFWHLPTKWSSVSSSQQKNRQEEKRKRSYLAPESDVKARGGDGSPPCRIGSGVCLSGFEGISSRNVAVWLFPRRGSLRPGVPPAGLCWTSPIKTCHFRCSSCFLSARCEAAGASYSKAAAQGRQR